MRHSISTKCISLSIASKENQTQEKKGERKAGKTPVRVRLICKSWNPKNIMKKKKKKKGKKRWMPCADRSVLREIPLSSRERERERERGRERMTAPFLRASLATCAHSLPFPPVPQELGQEIVTDYEGSKSPGPDYPSSACCCSLPWRSDAGYSLRKMVSARESELVT